MAENSKRCIFQLDQPISLWTILSEIVIRYPVILKISLAPIL